MKKRNPPCDVFLSYAPIDSSTAEVVASKFETRGLTVFPPYELQLDPAQSFKDVYRNAIAESRAFVIILSRASLNSEYVSVHLGAALSWETPVYVLLQGVSERDVPQTLRKFACFTNLSQLIDTVKEAATPLSDVERETLLNAYVEIGVVSDQLANQAGALEDLAGNFKRKTGSALSPERILKELVRLRNQRKLPKLSA